MFQKMCEFFFKTTPKGEWGESPNYVSFLYSESKYLKTLAMEHVNSIIASIPNSLSFHYMTTYAFSL